jgi:membrane protein YdbS with pleckstrin-like domain
MIGICSSICAPFRVVLRPFKPATEPRDLNPTDKIRANHIVGRVLRLGAEAAALQLSDVLENFEGRHRNLLDIFETRAEGGGSSADPYCNGWAFPGAYLPISTSAGASPRVLQQGEMVRHIAKISWVTYLPGLLLWAIAGILAGLLPSEQPLHALVLIGAAIIFAFGSVLLARAWFRRATTEIAVTDKRIIYKRGFIRRYTVEMHMDKVESVDVDQSILGRMFDYGDVIIHGTGMGLEPLDNIDHPLELRNHITAV